MNILSARMLWMLWSPINQFDTEVFLKEDKKMEWVLFLTDNHLNNKLFHICDMSFKFVNWQISASKRFSTHAHCVGDPDLLRTSSKTFSITINLKYIAGSFPPHWWAILNFLDISRQLVKTGALSSKLQFWVFNVQGYAIIN